MRYIQCFPWLSQDLGYVPYNRIYCQKIIAALERGREREREIHHTCNRQTWWVSQCHGIPRNHGHQICSIHQLQIFEHASETQLQDDNQRSMRSTMMTSLQYLVLRCKLLCHGNLKNCSIKAAPMSEHSYCSGGLTLTLYLEISVKKKKLIFVADSITYPASQFFKSTFLLNTLIGIHYYKYTLIAPIFIFLFTWFSTLAASCKLLLLLCRSGICTWVSDLKISFICSSVTAP